MLGPICRYSFMGMAAVKEVQKKVKATTVEFAAIEDQTDEVHGSESVPEDAVWIKASATVAEQVRLATHEIQAHICGPQILKYILKSGSLEEGGAYYRHCRSQHPVVCFRYAPTLIVIVEIIEEEGGHWTCAIMSALTGNELAQIKLKPTQTVASARNDINRKLLQSKKINANAGLTIQSFEDCSPNSRLAKFMKPSLMVAAKKMRFSEAEGSRFRKKKSELLTFKCLGCFKLHST